MCTEEQLYSKMFYNSRLKSEVDALMEKEPDDSKRIKITQETVRRRWQAEDEKTKKEVRNEHKRLVAERQKKDADLEHAIEKEEVERTPEEYNA